MRITKLPKATYLTEEDVTLIVQDGETRQIPRTLLAPPPPDDIAIDGNTLHLSVDGAPIGTGAELPIPAPWAKQITYNADASTGCINFTEKTGSVNGNPYAEVNVILPCAMYTRNETEILSVTPFWSDFRGISISADPFDEFRTKLEPTKNCIDISESFHMKIDGEVFDVDTNLLQALATENNAEFMRVITAGRVSETPISDGVAYLEYTYRFLFTETETRDAFRDELCVMIQNYTTDFTVQCAEIAYTKNAEVIQDVN